MSAAEGVTVGFIVSDHRDGFLFERKPTATGVVVFTGPIESERLWQRLQRRLEKEVPSAFLQDFMDYLERSRTILRPAGKT